MHVHVNFLFIFIADLFERLYIVFFTHATMDGERERCRVQFRNQVYVTGLPCYLHPTRIETYFERIGKIKVNKKGEKMVKLFFRDREKRTNFEG